MSASRDELHQLVDELPESQLPGLLADARRRLSPVRTGSWPPAWFGSATSRDGRTDTSNRIDELLAEGFGRDR
ncbi:hypothetical protein [Nocardia donostiensis]|uniref:DUF2281 domain-containing protein n=1 Tax=Nocardia donostiensis TaxID=1538463 RepID=A0A1V2TF62_9NOCA|nr:hypothetical protein [Nocardia donostiensis]ONM48159.1 hypothetical protein B0T46_14300 [Nocardia donostiensis]OQS13851.1 hypothetical protein B0T36_17080 [Nocardia donostiensis]OQS17549.1 hypothetical protein B0T44_24180 [Nocardia donostiensis]